MKKIKVITVVLVLSISTLIWSAIPASAAMTFVDTLDDYYSYIVDKSDGWQIEKNTEILSELNKDPMLYSKSGKTGGKVKDTVWLTYHMTGDITAFKIHTYNAAGLGFPDKDMKVEVSSDGKTWIEVATNMAGPTYDTDLYVSEDKAYWFQYDTTNKSAISSGNSYLRVSLLSFTTAGAPTWATVLHSVSITHNGTAAPSTRPTQSAATTTATTTTAKSGGTTTTAKSSTGSTATTAATTAGTGGEPQTTDTAISNTDSSGTDTTAATPAFTAGTSEKDASGGGGGLPAGAVVGIVIACVVVLGGGAAAFFIYKKHKRAD